MIMNAFKTYLSFLAAIAMLLSACGEGYEKSPIVIEGVVDVTAVSQELNGPVMVAILRIDNAESSEEFADLDMEQIIAHPGDSFVEYFSIDRQDPRFHVDVTESGLRPGDDVAVFAFVANNYANGVIAPKIGDVVGIGIDDVMDKRPLVHEIESGVNEINVKIDREYVEFKSQISGRLENIDRSAPMDIYVVAYMAENKMTTIDFSNGGLGIDGIIGYFQKTDFRPDQSNFLDYTLDIIPYLPYMTYDSNSAVIDNVSIFVWLDTNQNGQVDDVDFAGYYVNPEDTFTLKSTQKKIKVPASLDVQNQNNMAGINIQNFMSLSGLISESDSSQDSADLETIVLKGSVTLPEIAGGYDDPQIYIIIAGPDYATTMKEKPLDGLYYFNRIPSGRTDFEFEITNSHLQAGDEVMIVGLWDRDNQGWYPAPTPGDYLGLHLEMENLVHTYTIKAGVNSGIHIDLSRQVFDFDKTISGGMNIDINDYPNATATIVAYAGELNSLDITRLNPDDIIGMDIIKSNAQSTAAYEMPIFPFGRNLPIDNVCIYAILDENSDGTPDKFGYHANPKNSPNDPEGLWPAILRLEAFTKDTEHDITFFDSPLPMMQSQPQNQAAPAGITCSFDLPSGVDEENAPIFAAVFEVSQTDVADLFQPENMLGKLKYLQKIPVGEDTFTIGTDAGIYRGDEILISVFWDLDYNSCYPRPTIGDMAGYYNDVNNFGMLTVKLEDQGVETDGVVAYQFGLGANERFELSRAYYDHQATLKFNINEVDGYINPEDPITILAIQGDLLDLINYEFGSGCSINWQGVDIDRIVAYGRASIVHGDTEPHQYELKLMPFLSPDIVRTSATTGDFDSIEKVFLFVLDEAPGIVNGIPDPGEFIGYYHNDSNWLSTERESYFPLLRRFPQPINISNSTLNLPGSVFMPGRKPIEIP